MWGEPQIFFFIGDNDRGGDDLENNIGNSSSTEEVVGGDIWLFHILPTMAAELHVVV